MSNVRKEVSAVVPLIIPELAKLVKGMSEEYLEKITAEARQLKSKYSFVNIDLYKQLYLFALTQDQQEHPNHTLEENANHAKMHAEKLLIAFGDIDSIQNYLNHFKRYYDEQKATQFLHDACLFSLPPEGEKWDFKIWHTLLNSSHPSHPEDFIFKIFSFAHKIEHFFENHPEKVKSYIIKFVEDEFKEKYKKQYEEIFKEIHDPKTNKIEQILKTEAEWLDQELEKESNAIKKDIDKQYQHYLLKDLGFNYADLKDRARATAQDKIKEINNRKENPTIKDELKYAEIKQKINEKFTKKILKNYHTKKNMITPFASKEDYINDCLKNKIMMQIQKELPFSNKTSFSLLQKCAGECAYDRGKENPKAASIFLQHGIPEQAFNEYLSLIPQDDKYSAIPNITLSGLDIHPSYHGYTLSKLDPADPEAAVLGKLTSCCQWLGGQGEDCVKHGVTSKNGGFYVLRDPNNKIVAQCWVWRGMNDEIVFDSIESQMDFRRDNKILIQDFYISLADQLIENKNTHYVLCGREGNTTGILESTFHPFSTMGRPIDYSGYRDSKFQTILACAGIPAKELYRNKESKIPLTNEPIYLDETASKIWADICFVNQLSLRNSFNFKFAISIKDLESRIKLSMHWWSKIREWIKQDIPPPEAELLLFSEDVKKGKINININDFTYPQSCCTMLHYVLHHYGVNFDLVKFLIEQGAYIEAKNDEGRTPFHLSMDYQPLKVIEYLISQKVDIYTKNNNGLNVLHATVIANGERDRKENAIYLLKNSQININEVDYAGLSVLYYAIQYNKNDLELIKLLIEEYKADLYLKTKNGFNILHYAVQTKNFELIKYIVEKRGGITKEDKEDFQLLSRIVKTAKVDILNYFIRQGINLQFIYPDGNSILNSIEHIAVNIAEIFLKNGANVNAKDAAGKTSLYYFARAKKWKVIELLIKYGANNLDVSDKYEVIKDSATDTKTEPLQTLLQLAIKYNQINIIKLLLERKVNASTSPFQLDECIHGISQGIKNYLINIPKTLGFFSQRFDSTRGEKRANIYYHTLNDKNITDFQKLVTIYALFSSYDGQDLQKSVMCNLGVSSLPEARKLFSKQINDVLNKMDQNDHKENYKILNEVISQFVKYANADKAFDQQMIATILQPLHDIDPKDYPQLKI